MKKLFYLLLFYSAHAYTQKPEHITLAEVNGLAAGNYPLIQQRRLIQQTSRLTIENLQKGFLPQINLSGQASYQSEVTSLPVKIAGLNIESPSQDQYRVLSDVNQLVYDGGAIQQQKKIQHLNALVENEKIDIELQRLRGRINQIYLGILMLDEQFLQLSLADKDLQAGLKKVEAQVLNGVSLRSNAAVLKAELLKNDQRKTEFRFSRNSLVDVLSLFINRTLPYNVELEVPSANMPLFNQDIERRELRLFGLQDSVLSKQYLLINLKNRPRLSLYTQGGYGRPGLNLLKNSFDFFAVGGVRFNWSISSLYTSRREKEIVENNRRMVDVQKQQFLLNTNIDLRQQQQDISRLEDLLNTDKQIVDLREQVTAASYAQLQNGVLVASDYIREVNAADIARQNLVIHQLQLLQSKINYLTILGKQLP